jgi:hypothetical protein
VRPIFLRQCDNSCKEWRRIQYDETDDPRCFINFHAPEQQIMSPGKRLHPHLWLFLLYFHPQPLRLTFVPDSQPLPGGGKSSPAALHRHICGEVSNKMLLRRNETLFSMEPCVSSFFKSALGYESENEITFAYTSTRVAAREFLLIGVVANSVSALCVFGSACRISDCEVRFHYKTHSSEQTNLLLL